MVSRILNAREVRARLDRGELNAPECTRTALEDTLGLRFDGKGGWHFFQSTLIQTLFYGLFSAWVIWGIDKAMAETDQMYKREHEEAVRTRDIIRLQTG
jgi:hypothetical protein